MRVSCVIFCQKINFERSKKSRRRALWSFFSKFTWIFFEKQDFWSSKKNYITRPNCALDRRTIWCLYVPGFQNQTFKHVPKCMWIPPTKVLWIPRTNTCNIIFVGIFILLRIPQKANIASCSGFGNCKWIPQNVSEIRKM